MSSNIQIHGKGRHIRKQLLWLPNNPRKNVGNSMLDIYMINYKLKQFKQYFFWMDKIKIYL